MFPGPLLVLCVAMLPQSPEAGSSAFERRKAALIEELESAAVAEVPVFGIDTQVRAAAVLKDDPRAAQFLRDAGQRTLLLEDPAARSHFLKRIVPALLPLDAGQAESFCAAQSRPDPGLAPSVTADPLAVCYSEIVAHAPDWPRRKEAFLRALAAGAYDMPAVEELLVAAQTERPADFTPLLAAFVGAFPTSNVRLAEIERLAAIDRRFGPRQRALSRQARKLVADARREYAAAHPERAGKALDALEQASELTQAAATEAPAEGGAGSGNPFKNLFNFPGTSLLAEDDPGVTDLPDISGLSAEDAIRLARQQEYPGARAAMLSDVLDEKGAQLDQPRRLSLAVDILRDSRKMRLSSVRLIVQAELARWFHQQGDMMKAADAAQALEASFDAFVQCQDRRCQVFLTNVENSPGELIMTFAEYLWKYKIDPADLGLHHPGLLARWRLVQLQALLEGETQ